MRFLLLEAENTTENISIEQFKKEWRTADRNRREVIIQSILPQLSKSSSEQEALLKFKAPFSHSCYKYGIEERQNPFMVYLPALVQELGNQIPENTVSYVHRLVDMSESNLSLKNHIRAAGVGDGAYLTNVSLFDRTPQDFEYTLRIFETVLDPKQLSKYFKNTADISADELYDTAGKILPAGNESTASNTETIYGTVESWSKGGDNDAEVEQQEVKFDLSLDDRGKKVSSKAPKALSKAELERIKKDRRTHFNDLSQVDSRKFKDGDVIYVDFKNDMVKGQGDPNNWIDTWMVKRNGKWQKYNG